MTISSSALPRGKLVGANDKRLLLEGTADALLLSSCCNSEIRGSASAERISPRVSCDHCLRRLAGVMMRMRRSPFGPFLREDQPGLDGLSEADLIGKDRALGQRRLESEKRRFDLVRIEIDLRIKQGASELSGIGNGMPPAQLVRKKLGVVFGCHTLRPCALLWRFIQLSISPLSKRHEPPILKPEMPPFAANLLGRLLIGFEKGGDLPHRENLAHEVALWNRGAEYRENSRNIGAKRRPVSSIRESGCVLADTPLADNRGTPLAMHVGDDVGPTCAHAKRRGRPHFRDAIESLA